jgi:hypothetical protein
VRAEFPTPLRVKAAQEVGDGMSGRARLGLDARVVHWGARTGGSFFVYVVDGTMSVEARYLALFSNPLDYK